LAVPEIRPSPSQPTELIQPDPQAAETPELPAEFPLPEGAYTSLGGAIFLVNLLTRLQLPAIFPALAELNPWELLGAVTAELLGDRFSLHQADPLWAILNELAGLEPDARWGAALSASDSFFLPPEWLTLLPTETIACRLERQDGRSRLYYQETDLLIADLPDEDGRLDRLISHYDRAAIHLKITGRGAVLYPPSSGDHKGSPLPGYCAPNLAWYVVRMRPFLTHFLDHLTGGEPIESILRQPATLYRSRTHVDLRLSLEQISIPMRRAGLDHTPGWLPDFGYIVTIYFE
jgi:hypothetical protein